MSETYYGNSQHPTVNWYRDRMEWFGQRVIARMQNWRGHDSDDESDYTMELARLSAHFGRLVLGMEQIDGKTLVVMDVRIEAGAGLS